MSDVNGYNGGFSDGEQDPIASGSKQWTVPLFPLPNVVLLPNAILPLHIFEERYKAMTRAALEGDRLIAMALLRPGWEKSYHAAADIDPVVCIGQIVSHEELPDGRFNFLLRGMARARVVREVSTPTSEDVDPAEAPTGYRRVVVTALEEELSEPEVLAAAREAFRLIFAESSVGQSPLGRKFAELVDSPLSTPDLADLVAFNYLDEIALKQSLLKETDIARRLQVVVRELNATARPVQRSRPFGTPSMN